MHVGKRYESYRSVMFVGKADLSHKIPYAYILNLPLNKIFGLI